MDLLRRFRTEQTIEERRLETEWVESDRLFVKWDGRPMNPQTNTNNLSVIGIYPA